jgi:hypothetical protein
VAAPGPPVKAEQSKPSLAESSLYAKSRGGGDQRDARVMGGILRSMIGGIRRRAW